MQKRRHDYLCMIPACCAGIIFVFSGCVMPAYKFGRLKDSMQPSVADSPNQITFDGTHPRLNRVEKAIFRPIEALSNTLGIGEKELGTREQRMNESLDTTLEYLRQNELGDVYVDVRRYNPAAQWQRIRENKRVSPFWKYTAGTLTWATESILPPRVFRYSYYNAYTNTLAMNSVWREWNISEAARAKDFLGVKYPGTYAVAQHIPFVPIYQEVRIGIDALTYARTTGDRELELELYPYVYGEVFGSAVSEASIIAPGLSGLPHTATPLIWGTSFATGYGMGSLQKSQLELHDSQKRLNQTLLRSRTETADQLTW